MKNEQFDIETLRHIRNKLDYIYSTAKTHSHEHPELMETITSLAQIANMFAKIKMEELKGQLETTSPQGYIVRNLGNAYSRINEYEKNKGNNFPEWKL